MEGSGPHMTTFLHAGKGTAQSLKLTIYIATRISTSEYYIHYKYVKVFRCTEFIMAYIIFTITKLEGRMRLLEEWMMATPSYSGE